MMNTSIEANIDSLHRSNQYISNPIGKEHYTGRLQSDTFNGLQILIQALFLNAF